MRGVVGFASPLALAAAVFALGAAFVALVALAAAGFGAALVAARFGAALAAAALGAALALGAAFALGAAAALALGAALASGVALTLGSALALGAALAFGAAFASGAALPFGAALAFAATAGLGAAVARRFGLSSAGVGLRAMAASSLDTSRVKRCRPYRGGGSGVFPGGNETPLGVPRSPLRPGKQRAGAAALAAQHGSGRAMQRLTRPARAGQDGKWGGSCDASP